MFVVIVCRYCLGHVRVVLLCCCCCLLLLCCLLLVHSPLFEIFIYFSIYFHFDFNTQNILPGKQRKRELINVMLP